MTHSEYVTLFRTIAQRHKEIQHTESEPHFARLVLSRDVYMHSHEQISEFIQGRRRALHTPMLLLCSYEAEYRDDRSDNIEQMLSGRLIVLDQAARNEHDAEEAVYERTERIGEECLSYVAHLYSEEPQRGLFHWNGTTSEKLANVSTFFGTALNFNIQQSVQASISFNPDKFLPA